MLSCLALALARDDCKEELGLLGRPEEASKYCTRDASTRPRMNIANAGKHPTTIAIENSKSERFLSSLERTRHTNRSFDGTPEDKPV